LILKDYTGCKKASVPVNIFFIYSQQKKWIGLFFSIFFHVVLVAQIPELKFTKIAGINGKPIGKIRNISQDKYGYMWFSGEGGRCIYRYDGTRLIAYRHDVSDSNSLGSNEVNSVYADDRGLIWIGMTDGLDAFNPVTGIFKHYRHSPGDPNSLSHGGVTPVLRDHQGRLWVGTDNGLDLLDERNGTFIHHRNQPGNPKSLSDNVVWNLYEDRQGVLWIATGFPFFNKDPGAGGLNRLNPDGSFTQYKHDPKNPHSLISNKVRAIFEDSRGVFWVGTSGDGLHTMDRKTGQFERHLYDPHHPDKLCRPPIKNDPYARQNDQVTFVTEDPVGSIWIGTMWSGINRYDPATAKITHYEGSYGFPDSSAWNAFVSRDGVLWLSTQSDNLFRVGPFPKSINGVVLGAKVGRFLPEPDGSFWVATHENKLLLFDQNMHLQNSVPIDASLANPKMNEKLHCMLRVAQDSIWIGAERSLLTFNTKKRQFKRIDLGFNPADFIGGIFNITPDKYGYIWVATGNGIGRYNSTNHTVEHIVGNPDDTSSIQASRVICFLEDRSGEFWVGTLGYGMSRLNRGTNQFKHYLPSLNIISLFEDKRGTIWVCTSKGLYSYNKVKDEFVPFFDTQSDLSREYIFGVREDNHQNLWVITRSTITKVDSARSHAGTFGSNYGIAPFSLSANAIEYEPGGRVFVGYENGFYGFYPNELELKSDFPVIATDLAINNLAIKPGPGSPLKVRIEELNNLVLRYNQNNLSFSFASIDYRQPELIKYFTMMEGYDNTWREAIGEKTSYYFNMSPKKYTYRVRAVNTDGVTKEKVITIIINPPWWNTWPFRIAAILAIGGSFYAVMRWRIKQKFKMQLERAERERQLAELKQKSTELEMQALRAQMNPHFIFNSLNSINRFILQNNKAQASEYLTKFSRLVRLILQNSQASLIPLESELESLELYLNLESVRFNHHFSYEISVPKDLDISALQVPPLILQPYVENAIWHGLMHKEEKGDLRINVTEEDDFLCFTISDNGIGREKAAAMASKSATKLKSMVLRISALRIAILQKSESMTSPVHINDLVNPDGTPAGTEVTIKMPAIYE
jgi:ligand-binding sensor domain-containing protein